jgi:hypothetical protein
MDKPLTAEAMILFKLQEEFQNRIYLMGFTVKKTSAS